MMEKSDQFVVFGLDDNKYAIRLSVVERVVRAVEITKLPKAPDIIFGIVNVQGRVLPVVNVRKKFLLPEREIDLSDQLIIANTSRSDVVLVVDTVSGIVESPKQEITETDEIVSGMNYIEGIVKSEGDMILVLDLDKMLSTDEEDILNIAMSKHRHGMNK